MSFYYSFLAVALLLLTSVFGEEPPFVLVSVAPYKFFVEQIAQDKVRVGLMVPAGASAHTYEPSPKQMLKAAKAEMWFRLGEQFEVKAIDAIKNVQPKLVVVDLRQGLSLVHDRCQHNHAGGHCGDDLHVWLSPPMVITQVKIITEALSQNYPEQRAFFENNLKKLIIQLDQLDLFVHEKLTPFDGQLLMVSHPAYAYFCREYHLRQLPIEFEGKDPTAKQLTQILDTAKEGKVHAIFTQPQYSEKAAEIIANQIGAKVVSLDPYAEDYFNNMRMMVEKMVQNL